MNLEVTTIIPRKGPEKLLMKRKELERLKIEIEAASKTLVPVKLYFKESLIKCQIAIGTGKNNR